jgi:hypothetical protein
MLYPFHGSYTKIFTIFGSVYNLIHKFKHQSLLNKKEKEKENNAVKGLETGPQTGPHPHFRPASAQRAPAPSLSHTVADGVAPPVSFLSHRHGDSAATPATDSEDLGLRARAHRLRLNLANRLPRPANALLPPLHLNCITGGRPPWPTVGRPLRPGREQTKGVGRFKEV